MSGNIKVVVRCRPLNTREKTRGAVELVRMEGNQTIITKKGEKEEVKAFTFDHSYWSVDKDHPDYADQELVYNDMGKELLDHAFDGYNCCIFAYGQTGSGKSYTMMGYGEDKGIIPRTCVELFERIEDLTTPERSYQVEVSYIEIYNEKVRDLLNPGNKGNLKVREHPTIGPYVEDLSRLAVNSYKDIDHLMNEGNKARTVASTQMNATSSRSHAVFTLFLTSTRQDKKEKAARISLVDLAGSERATTTGATGVRLKEGANINKSLTTLGKVIAALADHHHKKSDHIPYRDSVLTWLLKDSLGGNSKTAMLAAISPADYDETLSTLRYADQAKKIKNKAVVNEDPNTRLIKDLKQELQALKDTLMIYAPEEVERIVQQKKMGHKMSHSQSSSSRASPMLLISPESPIVTQRGTRLLTTEQVLEQLETSEKLLEQANQTWEEKMNKTESIHREREKALEELGVIVEKNNMGVYAPKSIHLINLSEDPLMTECLMYHIKQGSTRVGKSENGKADIRLTGQEIMDDHCLFENTKGEDTVAEVTIHPRSHSVTLVNGLRIQEPKVLHHGYRIIFGSGLHHLFRFNHPEEAKRSKDKPEPEQQPEQQSKMDDLADWRFAHNEALSKFVNPTTDLDTMTDEDIQKLYYGISKVHEFRSRQRIASSDGTILDDESVTSTANGSPRTSTRFSNISTTTSLSTSRSEDMLKLEDEAKYLQVKQEMEAVMEQQKRAYESKIKRITRHLPPGTALSSDNLMVGYTSKNAAQYLVKKVVSQWRQWRYVKMAESCLVHAVVLKEANIMAKELGKDVTYQFTVVHDDVSANPVSHWESTSVLQPFTRELDPALMQEPKPCLAVQVIDHVHRVTYIWSIARIKSRLRRMRQIYDYNDRPLFAHPHFFKRDDPFYETPCPRFSLIGLARVPLRNLTLQLHADNLVDIYCRNTGQVVGQLKVLVTPIARSISRKSLKIPQESMEKYLLHIGQQQVFEIHIQEITGISESHFTQVHAQFHLSSFGNTERDSTTDKIYSTNPVSQFDKHISFDHCATLSIQINEKMMDIILNEGLTIEVYGQAQTDFLYQSVESVPTQPTDTVDVPISRRFSLDRRFSLEKSMYDGILMEERHDVLAWVQISELDAQGEYVPVPVVHEPLDIFSLRQGIQRRISLHLQHDSGKQFEWSSVESVHVNHARLVDGHGRVLETSTSSVQVPLLPQTSDCKRNGIFSIAAQGTWDSSLHNATFLNRTSSSGQYIRLTVVWHVKYDRCSSTLPFEMDIAVRIQGRDLGLFRQFFSSTPAKQVMKSSAKYVVHLKPQTTRQVCELWRLNTANKYVRGEEFIGSWKPRGVSLITDYREAKQKMVYREHVAAFRHALELARHPQAKEIRKNQTGEEEKEEHTPVDAKVLLEKVIRLWTKKFGTQEEITFNQDPPSLTPSTSTQSVKSATTNYNKDIKLVADIQQLYPSDTITKKGYLLHPKNVDEEWIKYWCVLKRPFIIIYEDNTETEEVGILNLASARVDYKSDLEKMLDVKRKNMFAVYTSNNAYFLEATDFDDMKDWVSKIDQFFPVDDLQGAQQ